MCDILPKPSQPAGHHSCICKPSAKELLNLIIFFWAIYIAPKDSSNLFIVSIIDFFSLPLITCQIKLFWPNEPIIRYQFTIYICIFFTHIFSNPSLTSQAGQIIICTFTDDAFDFSTGSGAFSSLKYSMFTTSTTASWLSLPVFLLRCVQLGISIRDLDFLAIGMMNDMYAESSNDGYKGYT